MGVAWPPVLLPAPVVSYTTFSTLLPCGSGLFLWPDPAAFTAPGVTRHLTLWSADFPRSDQWWDRAHPASLEEESYNSLPEKSMNRQICHDPDCKTDPDRGDPRSLAKWHSRSGVRISVRALRPGSRHAFAFQPGYRPPSDRHSLYGPAGPNCASGSCAAAGLTKTGR